MTTYKEITVNAETGEQVNKPYTAEQIAEAEASEIAATEYAQKQAKEATAKAALLKRLGITADEAALLIG